ncbi:MAG: helix-turn-helix domain-containing protein [Luteitalea sp.]|nr:helix-turn-helix domain-containing protein [Luteitalea sp.]
MIGSSVINGSDSAGPARDRPDHAVLFLDDVAALLRVSRSTIERRRRQGTFPIPELPPLDRRPRWSRNEVERFMESNRWTQPRRGRPGRERLGCAGDP